MGHLSKDKNNQSRINRLIGQLQSVKQMMDDGADCYKIIQQMSATKGALNSLIQHHLEGHIKEHLLEEKNETLREKAGEELVSVMRSYFK
jgi:DNA-binding FrmR family transcriptional regulator